MLAIIRHVWALAKGQRTFDRAFVAILLVADLAFIGMFVAYAFAEHYGVESSAFYGNVNFSFVDRGYPEFFGYGKQVLITLLLLSVYRHSRQPVYLGLSLLFAVSALDDSLGLHEAFGNALSANVDVSVSTGELVGWGLLGAIPMLAVLAGYLRGDAPSRRDAEAILFAFAILLFFAVGMDVVHSVISSQVAGFQTVLTIIEDGGELVTFTLICALSLAIFRLHEQPRRSPAG